MEIICVRLNPGARLKEAIYELASRKKIKAGIVVTCLGSLKKVNIRLAGAENILCKTQAYEILSLTGTFNNKNQGHFHISVSDKNGACWGGHLLDDNIIASTVEIAIGIIPNISFLRENDPETGYLELVVK
jgi:predicted DNA-binding protein with PD1-like motif